MGWGQGVASWISQIRCSSERQRGVRGLLEGFATLSHSQPAGLTTRWAPLCSPGPPSLEAACSEESHFALGQRMPPTLDPLIIIFCLLFLNKEDE